MSDQQLQESLAKLGNKDPRIREEALDEIGKLKPVNSLTIILPFLADEDTEVRGTAAHNLGEIHNPGAISPLIEIVHQDSDEDVRFYALRALSEYHHPDILKCLIEECDSDSTVMLKQAIADQLGGYDDEQAVEALIGLLQSGSKPQVLISTVDSLLKLNRPRLRDVWETILLNYRHPYLCRVSVRGLADLEQSKPFDIVLSYALSSQAEVRKAGVRALGCINDNRSIAYLIKLSAEDSVKDIKDIAISSLSEYHSPEIEKYLIKAVYNQQLSTWEKEQIAEQLYFYNSDDSVDALIKLFKDENDGVRTTALYSLYKLNRPRLQTFWKNALAIFSDNSPENEIVMKALRQMR